MGIDFPTATTVGQTYTDPGSGSTYVVSVVGPPAQWVGSGSSTNLDSTYLRKDASNDPVTGTLAVTPATNVEGLVVTQGATQTSTALRITNEGSGNSLLIEDSANPDSSPIVADSSGRLLVGATSAITNINSAGADFTPQFQLVGDTASNGSLAIVRTQTSPWLLFGSGVSGTNVSSGQAIGSVSFTGYHTDKYYQAASIEVRVDGTPGLGDMPGRLIFATTADGASSPTERGRIQASGAFRWTGGNGTPTDTTGYTTTGCGFESSGFHGFVRSSANPVWINRLTNDGSLIEFGQDTTTEGTISVSGTTVSYNGAHLSRWSQLPSGQEREEILRGTVLSNIDEMCEWGDEENEQLNRMKVSDVEGDKNVSGVFQAWDDDDDTYTNDFYCAMTGDFVIRIAGDVTVERGDLLMSAGDGTAKPQDDDIIRSKTIAKVTSTTVSCTYEDGSYCVPCVLMAC